MKKIGITGSLASGKTTASKILSSGKGPLFSADRVVKELYSKNYFNKIIRKKFNIGTTKNIKRTLKNKILKDRSNIKKLERLIHPLVRKEMVKFLKKYKNKKLIFLEIPLLIESKLMKNFDVIFFLKSKKSLRLKRFILKGGNKELFHVFNNKQLKDEKKIKYCDHVITNEKSIIVLKKNLLKILKRYE